MIAFSLKFDQGRTAHVLEAITNQAIAETMETLATDLRNEVEGLTPVGRDSEHKARAEKDPNMRIMKERWSGVFADSGGEFLAFENAQSYAPIVEFGLYPKEWNGTRTAIHSDGNRYSTQAMGGVLRPLLETGYDGKSIEDQAQSILDELIDQLVGLG